MYYSILRNQRGFSLVEILVVLVIMGLLVSIVAPNVILYGGKARIERVYTDFRNFESALKLYYLENYSYPSAEQGLEALTQKPSLAPEPKSWRQYIDRLPRDPWGNHYLYSNPGEHGDFDIYTLGSDGVNGGEGEARDRFNWEEKLSSN